MFRYFIKLKLLAVGYLLLVQLANYVSNSTPFKSPLISFNLDQSINNEFKEEAFIKTGTTIVGLCCKDGVILGADTRSTGGPLVVDKNKRKVHDISKFIKSCAAGTSADCDHICRNVKQTLALESLKTISKSSTNLPSVDKVAHLVLEQLVNKKGRQPSAVFIIGGADESGCKLFQIDSEHVPRRIPFGSLGSGSTNAIAVLESEIAKLNVTVGDVENFVDITIQEGEKIVIEAVKAGIMNDLGSGSNIDVCIIPIVSAEQFNPVRLYRIPHSQIESPLPPLQSAVKDEVKYSRTDIGKRVWTRGIWRLVLQNNRLNSLLVDRSAATSIAGETESITIEPIP